MEYQKTINLLDDTTNQPSKFRTRNWVDNSNIRFKTTTIRSSLCDYSDTYILVKGTVTVPNTAAAGAAVNNTNKKVVFKNCAPFTDCITEINNTHIDGAQNIDVVMSMYISIEYSNAYSKTSGSLWQYYRDEPTLDNNGNIIDVPDDNNNSALFNFLKKNNATNRKLWHKRS